MSSYFLPMLSFSIRYIKNVIIAGHNGSLRADYDRIVEELKKL
ncbi:hypothetical protein [Prevotella sp. P3-122]|nr:hypothetical protein [Prevotella sp. P3-122]